ncbi:hypothetical protein BDY19DRAFT_978710 [Irpex rosettiformis]|uniref:Uncharacterized protein n=1 Tax=Irpex rosettiformis TaxID=378272 RepID=A0ACB8TMY8_9APHY|nr:hypothetical protein BDY19DRAFT_978710 [Irpex rosettiformis]
MASARQVSSLSHRSPSFPLADYPPSSIPFSFADTYIFVGCNTVAVACYAAAGSIFGTVVAAPTAPAAIIACNAALGKCSMMCASVALLAPTP